MTYQVICRRDFEPLHVGLLSVLLPGDLDDLAGVHVVHVEVAEVLGPGDELLTVGGEVGRLDGKVLEVDRLNLRVELAVDLEEGGGARKSGDKADRRAGVELATSVKIKLIFDN